MGTSTEKFATYTSRGADAPVAFNYGDIAIKPRKAKVDPKNISVRSRFSTHNDLNVPLAMAPMDTVVGVKAAVAMSRGGGMPVLHINCSAEDALSMLRQVKKAESFIISDVVTIEPENRVSTASERMESYGFSCLPVVRHGRLVGIFTKKDARSTSPADKVKNAMRAHVITASLDVTEAQAEKILNKNRINHLPVVDREGRLEGLITYKDIENRKRYTNALRDENGRLKVAVAVSANDLDRVKLLDPLPDAYVLDSAHSYSETVMSDAKKIFEHTSKDVIIGNLSTKEAALEMLSRLDKTAGLRVGQAGGSICTTQDVTGAGTPTPMAVAQVADAREELGLTIPIGGDGGVRGPADAVKLLALGADYVMCGWMFAGCVESAAEMHVDKNGNRYKIYWGMASEEARQKRFALGRYANSSGKHIAEGVKKKVPVTGTVDETIQMLVAGIKTGMGYGGAKDIADLHENAELWHLLSREQKAGMVIEDENGV